MVRHLAAFAGLLILASSILAQNNSGVYTAPAIPSVKDLERLNLTMAWKAYVSLDSRADSIVTVQQFDRHVYVQTRSNLLMVLRAATGEEEWRMQMPKRYLPVHPVAVNADLVCVINGPRVYLLDRTSGKIKFFVDLPSTVAAGPAADIQQCFIVLSNQHVISVGLQPEDVREGMRALKRPDLPDMSTGIKLEKQQTGDLSTTKNRTPSVGMLHSLRPPFEQQKGDVTPSLVITPSLRPPYKTETGNRAPSIGMVDNLGKLAELTEIKSEDKPKILWDLTANRRMEEAPLLYGDFLILTGTDRTVFVSNKHARFTNSIRHEYVADAPLSAPIGQYGQDLYIAVADGNVYWMNAESFRNSDAPVRHIKRYVAPSQIDRKIVTTDDSVYLAGSYAGVTRLDRKEFEKVWTNNEVDRVLAVNANFVYCSDRRGNLVILDKARGLKMTSLDIRGFTIPIVNQRDDRLYLAAPNGLLICLHDRSFRRAELLRKKEPRLDVGPADEIRKDPEPMKPEAPKPPEAKKDAPEAKKDDAKKEEMKKEPDAKKENAKKDAPKKDEGKDDDMKKDDPKKNPAPKKGDAKKDAPKKDDAKDDDMKKDDPKKDAAPKKGDAPKKADAKDDKKDAEPKKDDAKKDDAKKDADPKKE